MKKYGFFFAELSNEWGKTHELLHKVFSIVRETLSHDTPYVKPTYRPQKNMGCLKTP